MALRRQQFIQVGGDPRPDHCCLQGPHPEVCQLGAYPATGKYRAKDFSVYEGGEDPAPQPSDGEGDEAFLGYLDLDHSYWYVHSNNSVRR